MAYFSGLAELCIILGVVGPWLRQFYIEDWKIKVLDPNTVFLVWGVRGVKPLMNFRRGEAEALSPGNARGQRGRSPPPSMIKYFM
jgi:hypothetical protein